MKVIREDYIRQGKSEDYIEDMIEMLENSNKLEKAAYSAKESLATTIKINREYQRDLLNKQREEEEMIMKKEANDFLNTLKVKNSIAHIPINNRDARAKSNERNVFNIFDIKQLQFRGSNKTDKDTGNKFFGEKA